MFGVSKIRLIADGISRWEPKSIHERVRLSRPDVDGVSKSWARRPSIFVPESWPRVELRSRLDELTWRVGGLGVFFGR